MDVKTKDRITLVYEQMVEARKELVAIRPLLKKEDEQFPVVMAWIAIMTAIAWLTKVVGRT